MTTQQQVLIEQAAGLVINIEAEIEETSNHDAAYIAKIEKALENAYARLARREGKWDV